MNYKACLFDFDYTLADSSQGIVLCFRSVLERHQFTNVTDDDIRRTIGLTLPESFSILTGITDEEQLSAMQREYSAEANIHMNVNTILYDETLQVLTNLKNKGIKIGIVSTKYRFRIEDFLKEYFPPGFFDVIIGGEDVINHKPAPEGILLACKKLQCKPKHILYVGDSVTDAKAAQAAGVDFVGVLSGTTKADELEFFPYQAIMGDLGGLLAIIAPEKTSDNKWLRKKRWKAVRRLLRIKSKKGPPIREINYGETILCKNCEHEFIGNYCNRCGQGSDIPRFKFKSAVKHVVDGMVRVESGFLYTLVGLLYRPGYLINDFISGKRVRYSSPFQTLFILAACYVLMIKLIDPSVLEKTEKTESKETTEQVDSLTQEKTATTLSAPLSKTGKELSSQSRHSDRKSVYDQDSDHVAILDSDKSPEKAQIKSDAEEESKKQEKNDSTRDQIDEIADSLEKISDNLSNSKNNSFIHNLWDLMKNWAHGNKAATILLTLPIFAFSTRLTFRKSTRNRHFNNAEHIIVQAYIATQILLVSMLLMPISGKVSWGVLYNISNWGVFALFFWDYKQLFGNSWWKTLTRTILMFLVSLLVVIILIIVVILLVVGIVVLYRIVFQ